MPYIERTRRLKIDRGLDTVIPEIHSVGDLNYAITRMAVSYMRRVEMTYERANSVVGVLTCAALELYRVHVAPYEDRKRAENGDVE